jgi:tetratricopeptide (TPR) repeat protein
VSLLLEALKKAEAAKRREDELDVAGAAAKPEAPTPAPPRITPAHELELIDDEVAQAARFAGLDVPEPRPAAPVAPAPGAEAARMLFDAKRPPPRNRSILPWALGAAALVLLGIGAWVMWQIGLLESGHGTGTLQAQNPVPATASVQTPAMTTASDTGEPVPGSADTGRTLPAVAAPPGYTTASAIDPATTPAATSLLPSAEPQITESSRFLAGQAAPTPPATAQAPETVAPVAAPIRVLRNAPSVPQDVSEGFTAFNAGELDRARIAYERALRADPRNPDALHGLAALARENGDEVKVKQLMRRIADVAPDDASAQVALSESGDPAMQEARLLNIAAAQPQSAPAALALGNLYASQARWREAQQAYFNAWSLAPDQPDHAYNLAVSLDQLRQSRLALQYYREALSLRGQRAAAFDAEAAARRIASLQAGLEDAASR